MEASSQGFLYRAMIQSPQFNISLHEDYCLSFWYNMYGKHIFSMTVYSTMPGFRNPIKTMVYKVTGPKSVDANDWIYAQMPIRRPKREVDRLVEFIFDGVRGQSFFSDIAIDDVKLEATKCALEVPRSNNRLKNQALTTKPSPQTTAPPPPSLGFLPKAYKEDEIFNPGKSQQCNPGNEKYYSAFKNGKKWSEEPLKSHNLALFRFLPFSGSFYRAILKLFILNAMYPSVQICCRGHVYRKTRGDSCCGTQPYFYEKQGCCMGEIFDKKYATCCNGEVHLDADYDCCGSDKFYKDEGKDCCKVKGGLALYQTDVQGCCETAGRVFNRTMENCCGSMVQMKFNKNDKCCGDVKPYMDLVVDCCEAPVSLEDTHYVS